MSKGWNGVKPRKQQKRGPRTQRWDILGEASRRRQHLKGGTGVCLSVSSSLDSSCHIPALPSVQLSPFTYGLGPTKGSRTENRHLKQGQPHGRKLGSTACKERQSSLSHREDGEVENRKCSGRGQEGRGKSDGRDWSPVLQTPQLPAGQETWAKWLISPGFLVPRDSSSCAREAWPPVLGSQLHLGVTIRLPLGSMGSHYHRHMLMTPINSPSVGPLQPSVLKVKGRGTSSGWFVPRLTGTGLFE